MDGVSVSEAVGARVVEDVPVLVEVGEEVAVGSLVTLGVWLSDPVVSTVDVRDRLKDAEGVSEAVVDTLFVLVADAERWIVAVTVAEI
jgi:hypothetical protein